jgi:hypothetical protein
LKGTKWSFLKESRRKSEILITLFLFKKKDCLALIYLSGC